METTKKLIWIIITCSKYCWSVSMYIFTWILVVSFQNLLLLTITSLQTVIFLFYKLTICLILPVQWHWSIKVNMGSLIIAFPRSWDFLWSLESWCFYQLRWSSRYDLLRFVFLEWMMGRYLSSFARAEMKHTMLMTSDHHWVNQSITVWLN